jgi:hypothetical protein
MPNNLYFIREGSWGLGMLIWRPTHYLMLRIGNRTGTSGSHNFSETDRLIDVCTENAYEKIFDRNSTRKVYLTVD